MNQLPDFNTVVNRILTNTTNYVSGALRTFIDTLSVVAPSNALYILKVKDAKLTENGEKCDGYVIVVTTSLVDNEHDMQGIMDRAIMKRFIAIDESGCAYAFVKYDETSTATLYSGSIN